MNFFKTDRLRTGAKEVDAIYEMADMLGYDVIKLVGKKIGHSMSAVFGFDVPTMGFDYQNRQSLATVDRGYVYFFPDNNGTKWGFCIDTPHNREVVASHFASPEFKPSDKKFEDIIKELCLEKGYPLVQVSEANPYIDKSETAKRAEAQKAELEQELAILEAKKRRLLEDLESAQTVSASKQAYHDELNPPILEEVSVNPMGEQEIIKVVASTPAIENKPVRVAPGPKAAKGKPLAKKTVKK